MINETKDPFLHGDFDSMDMFTRVTVENALLCFTAPNTKRDSVTPKMTFEFAFAAQQNDLRTFNQAFLPRKARKLSLETPPQCLLVIFMQNNGPQYKLAGKSNTTFSSKINRFDGIIQR